MMAHQIYWQIPQQVLCVELEEVVSLDDFIQINREVNDLLGAETMNRNVTLLVDITRPGNTAQNVAQLKYSQTYVSRRDLKFILVVGKNKLMRLMLLLLYNLCRPSLRFFDDMEPALTFLASRS
jgi:hypothetical protein